MIKVDYFNLKVYFLMSISIYLMKIKQKQIEYKTHMRTHTQPM